MQNSYNRKKGYVYFLLQTETNMFKLILLLLMFSLSELNFVSCCDEDTFNNTAITMIGVRGVDTITGCLAPVGPLEKVSYIQIVNETVPVLYRGAVKSLPLLVDLILENNGINDIVPGAFYNLSKIYLMRLRNNNLRVLREGVFNHLPVSELNLRNNSISVIEPRAFDNMPKLSIIILDNNNVAEWNSDWFTNTPKINTLSFKNNKIHYLPIRSFQNIRGFHDVNGRNVSTSIYLSDNQISEIDPHALQGLNVVGWLFLNDNNIKEIPENFLDPLMNIEWLKLSFNKLNCVPDKIIQKLPTIAHYLDGNPLTDECKAKLKQVS